MPAVRVFPMVHYSPRIGVGILYCVNNGADRERRRPAAVHDNPLDSFPIVSGNIFHQSRVYASQKAVPSFGLLVSCHSVIRCHLSYLPVVIKVQMPIFVISEVWGIQQGLERLRNTCRSLLSRL